MAGDFFVLVHHWRASGCALLTALSFLPRDLIAPNASHACLLVAGATGKPARGSAFHGVYFLTSQEEEE